MVTAFVNIDVGAVGNWAERRGISYSGYADLAGKPEVLELIRECVESINADLVHDTMVADSQIHRFLAVSYTHLDVYKRQTKGGLPDPRGFHRGGAGRC